MSRRLLFCFFLLLVSAGPLTAQLDTRLRISTRQLDFDSPCGVETCQDLSLENISTEPLVIRRFQSPQSPFFLSPTTPLNLPLTIPPGGTRVIRFCFVSSFADLINARNNLAMEVDTGDVQNPARDTIALVGSSRSGSLVIEPGDLDIGGILVGSQACRSITIRNDGNADLPLGVLRSPGAPFSVTPPIIGPLTPGSSITVDICFDPTSVGRFLDSLTIANGPCREPVTLRVSGAGMDLAPDIGPILQISPPNIDFDTTRCGTTKCRDITIRNVGNAVSVLDNFDSLIFPFSTSIPPTPLSLQPDSSIMLRICYDPPDAPRRDTQLVNFTGDSRYSLTIGTVFDVSRSMDTNFGGSASVLKIDAARDGGRAFLGDLISDTLRGVVDTAAVYEFARTSDFSRLQDYTTDIPLLVGAVPTIAFGFGTCIFYAVEQVVVDLRLQNFPGRRVIVLLTDGKNDGFCAQSSLTKIIADAQAAGVRVYTIGIGDPGDVNDVELSTLATETGGRYFFASDLTTLLAVYQQISEDLSKGAPGYFRVTGEGTAPLLEIDPPFITFDSVRVDSSRCLDVQVRNVGNALYPGGPLDGADAPFATATPILPPLAPGDAVTVQLCFGPSRLRLHVDTLRVAYQRCGPEELSAFLDGVGYDSVVVEMRDEYTGRPGSIVPIPIHLLDPLPAEYLVDTIRAAVRFNKTMLSVSPDFIEAAGTASEGMLAEVESVRYSGDTALVGLLFTGGPARSNQPTIELARLNFLVLLGNAMETDVEIYAGTFADGNPKVGRKNPALFRIDSLCYLPDRLLDGSARYEGRIKSVIGSGGKLAVTCEVTIDPAAGHLSLPVQVELYDRTGRLVRRSATEVVEQSEVLVISQEAGDLPSGVYFVSLRVGESRHTLLTPVGVVE